MFHLLLFLPFIILSVIIISTILFSVFAIVTSIVAGASTALFIKNKTVRQLLFIGFAMLSFFGFLFIIPLFTAYANMPGSFILPIAIILLVCIVILSIMGMKISNTIDNVFGKKVLIVVFCIVFIIAVSFMIFTLIMNSFFISS